MTESDEELLKKHTYLKPRITDHTLDDADLATKCPLDNGQHACPRPKHCLGQLDRVPLELMTVILVSLDLPSLAVFRRVNRNAMHLVDSLHEYKSVIQHCPAVLRAVIAIDAAGFSCATLYQTLHTTKCETCDRFGCYLYLITCKRVCYICFTCHVDFYPVTVAFAAKQTGLTRRQVANQLPHIYSLPGWYTGWPKIARKRIMLCDRKSVMARASGAASLSLGNAGTDKDLMTMETRRHMAIVSAPLLQANGRCADWGLHCSLCGEDEDDSWHFRVKFTTSGILSHLKEKRRLADND